MQARAWQPTAMDRSAISGLTVITGLCRIRMPRILSGLLDGRTLSTQRDKSLGYPTC